MLTVLGLDRIHKSMAGYVKSISKRNEGDDKEKNLPIAALGGGMVAHGDDFDAHSEYGRCLTSMFALNHTLRQETGDRLINRSVWSHRRACRTGAGVLHRSSECQLAGVS